MHKNRAIPSINENLWLAMAKGNVHDTDCGFQHASFSPILILTN